MATYQIRYHANNGNYSYLTESGGFKRNNNDKSIMSFNSEKAAQNYLKITLGDDKRKKILTNHTPSRFSIYSVDQKRDTNAKITIPKPQPKPIQEIKFDTIKDLIDGLNMANGHAMVMDLEFYNDQNTPETSDVRMQQIAGVMLNNPDIAFNEFVYEENHMSNKDQVYFWKNSNLTYQDALKATPEKAMEKVKQFMTDNNVDTIISWGNAMDFNILQKEKLFDTFNEKKAIDIDNTLMAVTSNAEILGDAMKPSLNLEAICLLLGLENPGEYHDALNDSLMIQKVCQVYMNRLSHLDSLFSYTKMSTNDELDDLENLDSMTDVQDSADFTDQALNKMQEAFRFNK